MNNNHKRQPIYGQIGPEPNYFLCWYKNEPENLQRFIPAARAGEQLSIGDYTAHYRAYFEAVEPADYMIDVGANIGLSAFPVASINHRVLCFEPVPVNVELIKKGIKKNRFESLIQIIPIALSAQSGTSTLWVPENRADNTSIDAACSNLHVKKTILHRLTTETLSFDQWWFRHKKVYPSKNARLFKIDTQGHEYSILQGAQTFLCEAVKFQKLKLEIEWDSGFLEQAGIDATDLLNLIDHLGYEIIKPVRLCPNEFDRFANEFHRCDLICKTRENYLTRKSNPTTLKL